MTDPDYIGFDPTVWLDRLIEVNRGSKFHPDAKVMIYSALQQLKADLRAKEKTWIALK